MTVQPPQATQLEMATFCYDDDEDDPQFRRFGWCARMHNPAECDRHPPTTGGSWLLYESMHLFRENRMLQT
eukprot:COSAG02_NODE_950_length_15694_cov_34.317794_2_plen_71_part_00